MSSVSLGQTSRVLNDASSTFITPWKVYACIPALGLIAVQTETAHAEMRLFGLLQRYEARHGAIRRLATLRVDVIRIRWFKGHLEQSLALPCLTCRKRMAHYSRRRTQRCGRQRIIIAYSTDEGTMEGPLAITALPESKLCSRDRRRWLRAPL